MGKRLAKQIFQYTLTKGRAITTFISKEYNDARILTNAATITLFMFMSIFPMLMILMSIVPHVPFTLNDVLDLFEQVIPGELYPLFEMIAKDIYHKSMNGSALSVTVIITLWTSSSGMSWLVRGVNDTYRKNEKRVWLRHRLISLIYTLIFIFVLVLTLLGIVFGHDFQKWIIRTVPVLDAWGARLVFLRYLLALTAVNIFVMIIYQVFPRNKTFFLYQLPGAIVATAGWYGFSAVYSFYLQTISNYSYTYGSLAAIVSMIIWLFISMNIILIGGEVNYLWSQYWTKRKEKRLLRAAEKKIVLDNVKLCDKL